MKQKCEFAPGILVSYTSRARHWWLAGSMGSHSALYCSLCLSSSFSVVYLCVLYTCSKVLQIFTKLNSVAFSHSIRCSILWSHLSFIGFTMPCAQKTSYDVSCWQLQCITFTSVTWRWPACTATRIQSVVAVCSNCYTLECVTKSLEVMPRNDHFYSIVGTKPKP